MLTVGSAEGRWRRAAPSLVSLIWVSMSARPRNQCSRATTPSGSSAGMFVTRKLTAQAWSAIPSRASVSWSFGMLRRRRERGSAEISAASTLTRRMIV